jgi:thiamine-phosphate pyrophosphorylase
MNVAPIGRLHFVTDTVIQNRYTHAELAERAIAAGVDTIQYRSKESDFRRLMKEASEVREVCRRTGVLFVVNDRVDLALAVDADGVHLGLRDMPVDVARRILGSNRIIGGTIRNCEQLLAAAADGADYVGLGPVFGTRTKQVDHPALGLEAVERIVSGAPIPVIAIAGISIETIDSVLATGVYGVAVIGAIAGAVDVGAAAAKLAAIVREYFPDG